MNNFPNFLEWLQERWKWTEQEAEYFQLDDESDLGFLKLFYAIDKFIYTVKKVLMS